MRPIFAVAAATAVLILVVVAAIQFGPRRGTPTVLSSPSPSASESPTASPTPSPTSTPAASATLPPTSAAAKLPAKCATCVRRADLVLGVSFAAPRDWNYQPAQPGTTVSVNFTSNARLSSYVLGSNPADPDKELLVEMLMAPSRGKDLDTFTREELDYALPAPRSEPMRVDGHDARRLTGNFQNGARVYVVVLVDPDRVFIAEAWPSTSQRIAVFNDLLGSIVFLPRSPEQLADGLGNALESSDWERIEALMRPAGWNMGLYRSEGSSDMTPAQAVALLRARDDDGTLDVTVARRPILQSQESTPRPEIWSTWRNFTAAQRMSVQRVELIFGKQGDYWFWQTGVFGAPAQ